MKGIAAVMVAMGVVACVAGLAHATEPFAKVRYGPTFVGFPIGARNIGMGATGTADATGLATGYFNPASVAFANATALLGSHEDISDDLTLSDAVISSPIPLRSASTAGAWRFAGAFGYTRMDFPSQPERTVFLPEGTGRWVDFDDWMATGLGAASWSRGVTTLAAGGAAKFIHSSPSDADLWAFDIGLVAAFSIELAEGRVRPRIGYSALNLDSGQHSDGAELHIQTEHRGGFGFDLETPPVIVGQRRVPLVTFSMDYDTIDRDNASSYDFSAGVELSVVEMFHVRYGVTDNRYDMYGFGVGWDFENVLFRLDYAHAEWRQDLDEILAIDLDRDTVGALFGVRW